MKVIKRNTGCYCHNCDSRESEYVISNEGSFKVFWAKGDMDCEIAFCECCARELLSGLKIVLNEE